MRSVNRPVAPPDPPGQLPPPARGQLDLFGATDPTLPGFVARDLLRASFVWADNEPQPYTPEAAVEALTYLISISTDDDERPAGFGPKRFWPT